MTSTQFPPLTTSYPLSFHIVAASLPSFSHFRPLFSITSRLFLQNTGGGGTRGNRSFGISSLRTLFPAPVYNSVNAVVPRSLSVRSRLSGYPRPSPPPSASPVPSFSLLYASLFPQPLSFHIHTK